MVIEIRIVSKQVVRGFAKWKEYSFDVFWFLVVAKVFMVVGSVLGAVVCCRSFRNRVERVSLYIQSTSERASTSM